MLTKYSDIRYKLRLPRSKEFHQAAAYLTHYWQNHGEHDLSELSKISVEDIEVVCEPIDNLKFPFEYDIPFPPPTNPSFTFIDLFAGIGGFRIPLQELNGKCVFSSEWNKHSQQTYEANFGEVPFGDITKIDENLIPNHDILVGGFPCQPFSIAGVSKKNALGKLHGFLDQTQGTLFFDIVRIINAKRPKAILLENVKNLKSHDKGQTFKIIEKTLEELGYQIFSKVIDAKYYVPQHRERIFIVGFDKNEFRKGIEFNFPRTPEKVPSLIDILEENVDPKYTLTDNLWNYLQAYSKKHKAKGNGFGYGLADKLGISRTLSARYYKDGSEILISQGKNNPRRLTPEECKRLMGFPEKFKISNIGVSDTQLYRQFGNSVAVPVVRAVSTEILNSLRSALPAFGNF